VGLILEEAYTRAVGALRAAERKEATACVAKAKEV
jgi:hypothetical protein